MEFVGTWWALVPPLVAIVLALITKETYSSLFVGIVVGALLLAGFDPINTVNYIICGTFGDAEAPTWASSPPSATPGTRASSCSWCCWASWSPW